MSSINDLSVQQLRKAASLKEEIEGLQKELAKLTGSIPTPTKAAQAPKKGGMSAAGRANIAAAVKARWAKVNAAKSATKAIALKPAGKAVAAKPVQTVKKSGMNAAVKAKLSAKLKAYWAAKKAAKK